jgi:N6-adenosine-specific RNA methylase IME4/ParB-like chromosome segregation protein Spo0J
MQAHPAADLFPLIEGAEFDALVADVAAHGVREPIVLHDGRILDGRNRFRAAQAAGVECPTREYDGDDPVGFVVSANLRRRHLNESQRAMIADTLATLPRGANQHAQICASSQADAADLLSVSRRNVQYARQVREADRAIADLVVTGSINLNEAKALIKLSDEARKTATEVLSNGGDVRVALRAGKKQGYNDRIASAQPKPLEGKYRIIYADPPWTYVNNAADKRFKNHIAPDDHYNCMTDEELCAYRPGSGNRSVKELADDDAVLFLWVTAPMLERCFPIIRAWGFQYKALFVWDKVRHNLGFYNSVRAELLLICTRGSCLPDTGKLIDCVQTIERTGRHSEKPREFYDIIEAMYDHGRKLELFARGHCRDGWDSDGNEVSLREAA